MPDDGSMVADGAQKPIPKASLEAGVAQLRDGVRAMSDWIRQAHGQDLGEGLIQIREAGIDSLEAIFADGLRRFDESVGRCMKMAGRWNGERMGGGLRSRRRVV